MRYLKFYGDPNPDRATIDGPIIGRQHLFASLGGPRDNLARDGRVVNVGVPRSVQGIVSGAGHGAYLGSADLWMAYGTGRAKLWPGDIIDAHIEGNRGKQVS